MPRPLELATALTRRRTLDVVYMQTTEPGADFHILMTGRVNFVLVNGSRPLTRACQSGAIPTWVMPKPVAGSPKFS